MPLLPQSKCYQTRQALDECWRHSPASSCPRPFPALDKMPLHTADQPQALPQSSPSSEPSPQSSLPSHSLSGGRQTEVLLAQGWEGGLQARASQFSSSELSSQSLSPSHTQALLMHRAEGPTWEQNEEPGWRVELPVPCPDPVACLIASSLKEPTMSPCTFSVKFTQLRKKARICRRCWCSTRAWSLGSRGPSYRLWLFLALRSTQHQAMSRSQDGLLLPMRSHSAPSHLSPCSQT